MSDLESTEEAAPRRAGWILPLLLILLCCAAYGNSAVNTFAMDDLSLVQRNPLIRSLSGIPHLFTVDYWSPTIKSGLYRPVVMTGYALTYAMVGLEPLGWHLINIALYALTTLLVYFLFRRVADDDVVAAGAAFLFGAHAVHTEVVANIAYGRPELLAGSLVLGSLLLHMRRFDPGRETRKGALYAGSLLCLGIGLLCKESAATVLGLIGLFDVLWRSDAEKPLWRRIFETFKDNFTRVYAGYLVVVVGYLAMRTWALADEKAMPPEISLDNPLVGIETPWRTLNALAVMFRYLWLLVFPADLSYDYSYNEIPRFISVSDWEWVAVVAGCLALLGITVWGYRRSRPLFFGMAFFLLTFSVASNVFVLIGTILGERLIFLPSVGFCLVAALAIRALFDRLAPSPRAALIGFTAVMAVIVGLHTVRAIDRNADWRSATTLYMADVVGTNSVKSYNNAAAMLVKERRYEEALTYLKKAIEILPFGYPIPYYTAGFTLTTMGRDEEAVAMYEGAIRNGDKDPLTRNNLGFILVDKEIDIRRGLLLLQEAVQMWPKNAEFRDSLGWGYYKAGRLEDAKRELERSLALDSESPSTPQRRAHLDLVLEALQAKE